MKKPTNKNKIERQLAWWNEVSPGVVLIIGYLLFGAYWLITPDSSIFDSFVLNSVFFYFNLMGVVYIFSRFEPIVLKNLI